MVLTREELIAMLQNEVRILVHLAGKVDPTMLDYRPTNKQRSTLELLQYMAIMAPIQLAVIKGGVFDRPTLMAFWGDAITASKTLTYEQAVAAIGEQSASCARELSQWPDADFRMEIDMFGNKMTRGTMLVAIVLGGFAAYRTQLFCYLKSCGREELNTVNLWMGMDGPMGPAA